MNKAISVLFRIFKGVTCGTIILIVVLYFGLWIYITKSTPEELKQQYDQASILNISDDQYKIIWFVWTENKNYEFKRYPFLIEYFFRDRKDNLDNFISFYLINTNEKYRKPYGYQIWDIHAGLARYIRRDNNYKKCLSIILPKAYMGKDIYGFENACEYYYNKKLKDVTEKELISIALSFKNPMCWIGSNESEYKTNEILNKYNN